MRGSTLFTFHSKFHPSVILIPRQLTISSRLTRKNLGELLALSLFFKQSSSNTSPPSLEASIRISAPSPIMATVTATTKLEAALTQAVKDGKVPNAIVYATNVDGSKQYHFATGYRHYGVNDEPIQEDSILMLASQTKLLTTIAALQIVEKGLISLDEDVCPHLLELAKQPILQGFDEEDIPKLTERKNPITLR